MLERLITVGVYGKSETEFFDQLTRAGVELFCDIRQRRGVRGSQYAFVNSTRLQAGLAARGIAYQYIPQLAPTTAIREEQYQVDQKEGATKRTRAELGDAFKRLYLGEILDRFDTKSFRESLGGARRVALFCVEGTPAACHRSLVSDRLRTDWNVPVEHL
jgi:uncharacterized protein (DUF488 family)